MAVHAAVRSRTTRLIESLSRIHTDPHRVTEVLFLSDMLESTRELDLERTRLTSANLVGLAQSAFERYGLSRGLLDGVTVYCVLDSPPIGGSVKINDRQTLERFWRLILTSAGANLAGFDSRIQ